jgi:xylan 1,4-beta-xylosidase
MTIYNPIIPGFHPDPSVIRVGGDYYLVTSSFEYFPGVPIFHSTDLVNWKQIGHVLTRKSQLNLDGIWPSGGVYAPVIRYHKGTFYMITTTMGGGGNFYVTATHPAGSWSEPVWVDPDIFDPSLLFDDDGKVYYTRRGAKGIVQAEIDIDTGKLLTPLRTLTEGFICSDIEGPHLYKINGLYYLMAAEGGTRFGHCEVIGRSASPWGPFMACPHNPILTHRDQGHSFIRDTGHAELVEDTQGNWWLFCLGTRNLEYISSSVLGRETFLAPVRWVDGWPVVGAEKTRTLPLSFDTPLLPEQSPRPGLWWDEFDSPELNLAWNFLRNPAEGSWSLAERPGFLSLHGSALGLDDVDSPAFVGRRQEDFQILASCRVEFQPHTENEEAGLAVYLCPTNHYEIAVTLRSGQRCAVVKKRVGDLTQEIISEPLASGPVRLVVRCDGKNYTFDYAQSTGPLRPGETHPLASGLARLVAPEAALGTEFGVWTGVYFGLYATGQDTPCREPADFDWFEYRRMENP